MHWRVAWGFSASERLQEGDGKVGESLKRQESPFRADQAGSLLRTEAIKEARAKRAAGEISAEQLREVEDREIARIVAKQKEVGLTAVTDGEFRRAWWHFDFLENLVGVEGYQGSGGIQFAGVATKSHKIRVVRKIDFQDHPMLRHFTYLKSIAGDHVPKMTIPSPNMWHFGGRLLLASTRMTRPCLRTSGGRTKRPSGPFTTPVAAICSWTTPPGPCSARRSSAR